MENNEREVQRISLLVLVDDFLREAKRLLVLGVALAVLFAACLTGYRYSSFTPVYEAYASFTVRVANPLYASVHTYNASTAEQMAKTFPYILTSTVLQERVKEHLDVDYLPSISASSMQSSNIFTLRVRDTDPERAYQVLEAVITCYPEVADFVLGPTVMVLLDESGVPSAPANSFSAASAVKQGAVIGLAIWAVIVLLVALTKTTVHSEEELKDLLSVTCLGQVPAAKVSAKYPCPLISEKRDRSGFGESIRLLRLRMEKELAGQEKKVLMVSSAIPGEGKTTVAVNLAISLAMKGNKVLIIDCDTRNPSVARALRMKNQKGFAEFISGEIATQGLIWNTKVENLTVITGGVRGKETNLDSRASKRAAQLIASARKVYDYVILDTPPCSLLADASEMARMADCALLVVRQDFAARDQILDGVQSLSESGLPLLGCVLNGVQSRLSSGYGYGYGGYGSGYGYGYGYGYGNKDEKSE